MSKTRVMVVDDAVVIRRVITDILKDDPELEVVASAANGRIALSKLSQTVPDIIVLDVEMPELDGLGTLSEIRKLYPQLPVIMFSALTERGATATLDALQRGANDYITKPTNANSFQAATETIRDQLIPKIKSLCRQPSTQAKTYPRSLNIEAKGGGLATRKHVSIVGIGVSTGGPNALAEVLSRLPKDLSVPIVIVQHMPPVFTRMLADRLTAKSPIPVSEAKDGEVLTAGKAWIAPGDFHLTVVRVNGRYLAKLNQQPPENSCRPAVDVLFRSLAECAGPRTLAVVLTGMGQDGLRGSELIAAQGGQIIAQDQATSVVWGMPGFVARAGLADTTLPINEIANEIVRRVQKGIAR